MKWFTVYALRREKKKKKKNQSRKNKNIFNVCINAIQLSLVNLGAIWAGAADIPAFRSMRTLRALRPLRAVSRWEGMRVSNTISSSFRCSTCATTQF